MKRLLVLASLVVLCAGLIRAQGFIEAEGLTSSQMNDREGTAHGRGDMARVRGRFTVPLSSQLNENQQPTAWALTASAAYAWLNNSEGAQTENPERVVNASMSLSHTRPLSEHWLLMASLGAGIYADADKIAWRSVLASGAVIFAYRFSGRLSAGLGVGLTNSYGVPMVMPMGYLAWHTGGNVDVRVNMANSVSIKVSTMLNSRIGIELTALEIDGLSAVRRIDGKSKIYASTMMRSTLSPTFKISKKTKLHLGIGGVWLRSVKTSNRSLKSFFDSFGNDDGKYRFCPSLRLSVGLSYGL